MKKIYIIIIGLLLFIIGLLILLPIFKIDNGQKIMFINYSNSGDNKYFNDSQSCYDDGLFYYQKDDITVTSSKYKKFWFIYVYEINYISGNSCDHEFLLTVDEFNDFLRYAKLVENKKNINLNHLTKGRQAVVKNKRYPWPASDEAIVYLIYKYNNKLIPVYVWNDQGSLIIQLNNSDEGPKYIMYK